MSSINRNKYARAEEVFERLRSRSRHYNAVLQQDKESKEWSPVKFNSSVDFGAGREVQVRAIARYLDLMSSKFPSGLECLQQQSIGIWYMIMGSVGNKSALGTNTTGLRLSVDWEGLVCEVGLEAGIPRKLAKGMAASAMMASGMNDRSKIQKATGWDTQVLQRLPVEDISTLETLIRSTDGGHVKLTRLVKGCLMYIDLECRGEQRFQGHINNIIAYDAHPVINSFRARDRSYAFCSKSADQYVVLMHLIGQQYPYVGQGVNFGGNVTVPADAGEHFVVMRGGAQPGSFNCVLNSRVVWTGVTNYAREMEITDQLEVAMVIAASLYENRYLRTVKLPKVESTIDLVRPIYSESPTDDHQRPFLDKASLVALGRTHQMGCFLVAKDMIIAAKNSTKRGMDYESVVLQYLKMQESVMLRMVQWISPISILSLTKDMRWMSSLSRDDIADLDSISIFEGLWMCDSKVRSIENGGIACLFHGYKDLLTRNEFVQLLEDELSKIGVALSRDRIPSGRFSVRMRCFVANDEADLPMYEWQTVESPVVLDCNYEVHRRHHATGRRARLPARGKPSKDYSYTESTGEIRFHSTESSPDARKKRRSFLGNRRVGLRLPGMTNSESSTEDVRVTSLGRFDYGIEPVQTAPDDVSKWMAEEEPEKFIAEEELVTEIVTESEGFSTAQEETITEVEVEETVGEVIKPIYTIRPAESVDAEKPFVITNSVEKRKYQKLDMESIEDREDVIAGQGSGFNGQVKSHWGPATIFSIRESNGWKKHLAGKNQNPDESVVGRPWHMLAAEMYGDEVFDKHVDVLYMTLRDSRTKVDLGILQRLADDGSLARARTRDVRDMDSVDKKHIGFGDAYLADLMYSDDEFRDSLGKKARERLMRHYVATPAELGKLRRALKR